MKEKTFEQIADEFDEEFEKQMFALLDDEEYLNLLFKVEEECSGRSCRADRRKTDKK